MSLTEDILKIQDSFQIPRHVAVAQIIARFRKELEQMPVLSDEEIEP